MLINLLVGLVLIYVTISGVFYFFQHYFFFRPELLPSHFQYTYEFPHEELHFDMEDGGKINAVYFKVPNSKGVIYFLKGNSRSIKGWGKFAKDFVGNGYDFFMMDYRGFGKSRGKRSESIMYSDAQYLYKWLSERYDQANIVVMGRSLGSGFAARIASWNQPQMLILDSPYYSFAYQTSRFGWWLPLRWFLKYKIPTWSYIKQCTCPVHIIHGEKDFLISYRQGEMLRDVDPEKVKLHTIPHGRHNNLPDFKQYHEVLYAILND
jgi:alpha-beta hydrolase superfamily lysophospholipase